MQDAETMANMMKDLTQYIMMPKFREALIKTSKSQANRRR